MLKKLFYWYAICTGAYWNIIYMHRFFFHFFLLFTLGLLGQTKVGGIVSDESGQPVAFANVLFQGSTEGTITNDNGRFYLESDNTYNVLVVSFIGYENKEISLTSKINYNM